MNSDGENMKIKKFPIYIVPASFELPIKFEASKEDAQFDRLFAQDQLFDFFRGLLYAEQNFLQREIATLTPGQLEQFIKELHYLLARTTMRLNSQGHFSGRYNTCQVQIIQETGHPWLHYEKISDEFFSMTNYNIIKQLYGKIDAHQYKKFCKQATEIFQQQVDKINDNHANKFERIFIASRINYKEIFDSHLELANHPGYEIFKKIVSFSAKPEEIPSLMKRFCEKLVHLIQTQADPIQIASCSLELGKIHPFINGNGRLARLLMNCILMSYGIPPLKLDDDKSKFYELFETSTNNNNKPTFENYLRTCIANAPKYDLSILALPEDHLANEYAEYLDMVVYDTTLKEADEARAMGIPLPLIHNVNYCAQKASTYQLSSPEIAIYYLLRATDFISSVKQIDKILAFYYLKASYLCKEIYNVDVAYELAKKALFIYNNLPKIEQDLAEIQSRKNIVLKILETELAFIKNIEGKEASSYQEMVARLQSFGLSPKSEDRKLSYTVNVPQGRSARLLKSTLAYDIDSLFTDGFSTCNILVAISSDKILLLHGDLLVKKNDLKNELEWFNDSNNNNSADIVLISRAQGSFVKKEYLSSLKEIRPDAKIIINEIEDQYDGIYVSFLNQENVDIHPKIRKYPRSQRPQNLIHQPDEQFFNAVHKIEQIIGMKARAETGNPRIKKQCIFDGQAWEPIPEEELKVDCTHPITQQEMAFFKKEDPYITMSEKLAGVVNNAAKVVTIMDNMANMRISVAVFLEAYLNGYDFELLFKQNMLDTLNNYQPKSQKDKEFHQYMRKLFKFSQPQFNEVEKYINDYKENAPPTEFKEKVLGECNDLSQHYASRKYYHTLTEKNKMDHNQAISLSREGINKHQAGDYQAAANLFLDAIKLLTRHSTKESSSLATPITIMLKAYIG